MDFIVNKKINIKDLLNCLTDGFKCFINRFFLHTLTTLLIPILISILFTLIYLLAITIGQETFILPISYPLFCMMIPLMMANIAITEQIQAQQISKINYLKYIYKELWSSGVIRLIIICALLQTIMYLSSLYAINSEIGMAQIIYHTLSIIAIIFQIIIFFAVPSKIYNHNDIPPFKWILQTIKTCFRNFIPLLLLIIINIAIILLISLVLPKAIWSIYIFIIFMILLTIYFGIVCSKISHKIF